MISLATVQGAARILPSTFIKHYIILILYITFVYGISGSCDSFVDA